MACLREPCPRPPLPDPWARVPLAHSEITRPCPPVEDCDIPCELFVWEMALLICCLPAQKFIFGGQELQIAMAFLFIDVRGDIPFHTTHERL